MSSASDNSVVFPPAEEPRPLPPRAPQPASASWTLAALLLLSFVTVAVFARVASFQYVNWDDPYMFLQNPHVQHLSLRALRWMFTDSTYNRLYMPLGWLGYALSAATFGITATAQHAVGIFLHVVNACLVFALLKTLLGRLNAEKGMWQPAVITASACAGALLWALHPLRVEVVAWTAARVHSMAAVPALLSLWIWIRNSPGHRGIPARTPAYALSLACYAASILTFPIAIALPGVLFVVDAYVLTEEHAGTRVARLGTNLLNKIPFLLVAAIIFGISMWGRLHVSGETLAAASVKNFGILPRFLQGAYVWMYYAVSPFTPAHLSPIYDRLAHIRLNDPLFILSAVALLLVTGIGFFRRRRHPLLWAAWLCHLLILLPFLGLTEHPHYAVDRYSYLDAVLWSCVAAAALARLWTRNVRRQALIGAAASLVIFLFAAMAYAQTGIWRDTRSLFLRMITTVGNDPHRPLIDCGLAQDYAAAGETQPALHYFDDALRVDPTYPRAYAGEAAITEASAKEAPSDSPEQRNLYLKAASLYDHAAQYGRSVDALRAAALCYLRARQFQLAEDRLERSLLVDPRSLSARLMLADAYAAEGNQPKAFRTLDAAEKMFPQTKIDRAAIVARWNRTTAPAARRQ